MFNSMMVQLQRNLYENVLDKLQTALAGNHSYGTGGVGSGNLKAHPSQFDAIFEEIGQRYQLDPALLKAVAQAESGFSADAVSKVGAKGMMQLMDSTAEALGVDDVFDPVQNIDGGARYLKAMLDRYNGDVSLALAAYNAGPGAVDKWGGLPPFQETQAYIPRVLNLHQQYHDWVA